MYMGFKAVEESAAASGARNPAAVAAAVGRKKYGGKAMGHASALGRKKGHGAAAAFLKGLGKG
jgi:hypothetical protein